MSAVRGRRGLVIPVPARKPSEGVVLGVLAAVAVVLLMFTAALLAIGMSR